VKLHTLFGISAIFLGLQFGLTEQIRGPGYDDEFDRNNLFTGNIKLCNGVANKVFLPFVGDCNKYYLCWGR